jgi:hypothetical protein
LSTICVLDEALFDQQYAALDDVTGRKPKTSNQAEDPVNQTVSGLFLSLIDLLIHHTGFFAGAWTKAANWRSSALDAPVRHASAMDWDAGSGKISSSPLSIPSKMPAAAYSGEAFGISKPRFISVSMGPRMTAWTITPLPAKIALSDCVMFNAAAFEMEYAGIIGKAASATKERLLTMAPLERVSSGRKARDRLSGPKKLNS